jgi:hypothetical protein
LSIFLMLFLIREIYTLQDLLEESLFKKFEN